MVILVVVGKAAGKDKKLMREIRRRELHLQPSTSTTNTTEDSSSDEPLSLASSAPGETREKSISPKLLCYLISTLNMVFPDYDFRYAHPPK